MGHTPLAVSGKGWRRIAAFFVSVLGALLIWLSPDQLIGIVTVMAGVALEVVGIHLEHTSQGA